MLVSGGGWLLTLFDLCCLFGRLTAPNNTQNRPSELVVSCKPRPRNPLPLPLAFPPYKQSTTSRPPRSTGNSSEQCLASWGRPRRPRNPWCKWCKWSKWCKWRKCARLQHMPLEYYQACKISNLKKILPCPPPQFGSKIARSPKSWPIPRPPQDELKSKVLVTNSTLRFPAQCSSSRRRRSRSRSRSGSGSGSGSGNGSGSGSGSGSGRGSGSK